jgi:hypothetical protein
MTPVTTAKIVCLAIVAILLMAIVKKEIKERK